MGDRCSLTITTNRTFRDQIVARIGEPDEEWTPQQPSEEINLEWCEINYGGWDEMNDLAQAGALFWFDHTAGGDYPATMGVTYQGELIPVERSWDGYPVVGYGLNGLVQDQWDSAQRYWKAHRALSQHFGKEVE